MAGAPDGGWRREIDDLRQLFDGFRSREATLGHAGLASPSDKALLSQLVGGGGWIAVAGSFAANWSDFDATNQAVAYRRNALGVIELRGLAKKAAAIGYPDTIFTLPAGYRPAKQEIFASVGNAGAGDAFASIGITSAGVVALRAGGGATWVSLAGIAFRAD